jgi:hypothetical protein
VDTSPRGLDIVSHVGYQEHSICFNRAQTANLQFFDSKIRLIYENNLKKGKIFLRIKKKISESKGEGIT